LAGLSGCLAELTARAEICGWHWARGVQQLESKIGVHEILWSVTAPTGGAHVSNDGKVDPGGSLLGRPRLQNKTLEKGRDVSLDRISTGPCIVRCRRKRWKSSKRKSASTIRLACVARSVANVFWMIPSKKHLLWYDFDAGGTINNKRTGSTTAGKVWAFRDGSAMDR